uniref:FLYWCH-type domain-containing protein n=1 Tax=Meloidogyne floridensis TaxID=298350 RepID=A0A915PE74_9BILA
MGFAYTKHRLSVDGRRTYWRCERRSSLTGCHGRAVTIGNEEGQPVLLTVHHNHPPSEKYGPLTGGTGVHGWAIGGDVVGTSSSNTTPPPTNVRGVPIVPKISRCDIARTYGETVANSSRKRPEDTPNSPQNCSSYSTLEQFINSHSDNNLPPFLESAQDNFNVEIAMKRPHLEDNNDGAELGELYSTEGFFDPNNESCKDNEHAAKLDLLKKEWEEFPSYDPSQPSSSSLAAVQQSADALIKNSSSNQINTASSSSFGGTALIREKSQLDFFLQLPVNTEFTSDQHGCGTATNDMKQMPTTQEWENDPRTIELRKQLNDALDRERNSQHKLQKTVDELLDARSEIDVKNAKNERLEKRLKNANDELVSLREQLDQSMDHRETLERQQFELNLKESRKRTELQRELEAKEDEMEEMSSNSPENRTLKGKLARAMALIQSSKIHFDKDSFEENSQLRNLKNNLGSSVFSSVCGGSEFGDLEDVLLEEEGKELEKEGNVSTSQPKLEDGGGGECASRETITSLLAAIEKEQQFDGANSDTIEGSS